MKLNQLKEEIRSIIKERSVNSIRKAQDKNFKDIEIALDAYKKAKAEGKDLKKFVDILKKLGNDKKALEKELFGAVSGLYKDAEYQEESVNEGLKHLIHVETPKEITSKNVVNQITALAKKGVRSYEIGLNMGFIGNNKAAVDAFQKVKNKVYFDLHKNESVNESSFQKGKTYGGTKCEGGCYVGKQGLIKLIKISKDNPNNVFMFRDDNYSGIQPHFIKNGVIAIAKTINPSYDLERNKVRNLKIGNDVILSVRLFESVNEISYTSDGNLKIKKQYKNVSDYEKNAKAGDYVWVGNNPNDFKGISKNLLSKVLGKDSDGNAILTPFGKNKKYTIPQKTQSVIVVESIDEATTSWSRMMQDVRKGGSGPWSLVGIENNKVVAQKNSIKDKNLLPAHFEAMRRENPKAKIHIEDAGGQVVWNEKK